MDSTQKGEIKMTKDENENEEPATWVVGDKTKTKEKKKGSWFDDQISTSFWETPAKGSRAKTFNLRLSHIQFETEGKPQEVDIRLWRSDGHTKENGPTQRGVRLSWEQAKDLSNQLAVLLCTESGGN